MKLFLTLLGFLLFVTGIAQVNIAVTGTHKPLVFVDSVQTSFEYFTISTADIESVNVIPGDYDPISQTKGKIYIKTKNPQSHIFVSIADFTNRYASTSSKPLLLLFNGRIIPPGNEKNHLDASGIIEIEIEKGPDYEQLKNIYASRKIINIKTRIGYQINADQDQAVYEPK
jgi:hypothetical protein